VTLQAYTFTLTTREADTLGLAVLCPEARYASVQLAGVKRLLRRHPSPTQWKEIERLIAERLQTKPMATGVFHEVLAGGDEDKRVAYLHVMARRSRATRRRGGARRVSPAPARRDAAQVAARGMNANESTPWSERDGNQSSVVVSG
jgi:hypothetical protein